MGINGKRLSITEVARAVGVTPRTIMRWEKAGKIKKSKRDWRGWRFYQVEEVDEIRKFYETAYEYEELNGSAVAAVKETVLLLIALTGFLMSSSAVVYADAKVEGVTETTTSVNIDLDKLPVAGTVSGPATEAVKYTLGPDDVIFIEVRNHPEFTGQYIVNSEGKIEYKYVGDVILTGLNKVQAKERITQILSEYIIEPDVDVQIVQYLSKVFYVVGEVGRPGKFYMKGDTIEVREALVQAGLPTYAAAMRRCRLITPNKGGKNNYADVNVYSLLYEGDLSRNVEMKPGDVLYVPATAIAKLIQVISPVTNTVSQTARTAVTGAALVP
ncbi:hypothetical protein A3H12_04740 [Candidatus Uhrbacteria bacterium RIFCSPLOWO2_12_FULL_47_9]|nr:MAG: hypothetical protein A3H12_04740 [Candidatus Uhrbacteria bacterium RIFCSPLOWO2_12_FULL_47_9]